MNSKQKITEILKAYTKKHNISASSVILEEYAEELLANGVIVPIRCKDCEYYIPIKQQSTKWEIKTFYCTRNANMKMNENDYCSCAKLKEREGK